MDDRSRPLTPGEIALVRSVFGRAIDPAPVRVHHRRWFPFQPRETVMGPQGEIHIHPASTLWRDDFAAADTHLQGLFLHEMTHVWQAQNRGRWYLPLMRHPFCRYHYSLRPGWPLERYGVEQQAEIVRHAFLLGRGVPVRGAPGLDAYRSLLPFRPTA